METTPKIKFTTVQEYLAAQPRQTKVLLQELRKTIKAAAPQAEEVISYNMPAFKQHRMLVWYAGYKGHIGFYPGASGIATFKKDIAKYKWAKGSVQFPIDEPLPLQLITKIVQYRLKEDAAIAAKKGVAKK
jgi:uncharacterized protein YdhG (YjbR/CyaY superfamily)